MENSMIFKKNHFIPYEKDKRQSIYNQICMNNSACGLCVQCTRYIRSLSFLRFTFLLSQLPSHVVFLDDFSFFPFSSFPKLVLYTCLLLRYIFCVCFCNWTFSIVLIFFYRRFETQSELYFSLLFPIWNEKQPSVSLNDKKLMYEMNLDWALALNLGGRLQQKGLTRKG